MVNKRVWNAVLGCSLKNDIMISVRFWGKPFNITVIQVYAPTSNAEKAEVEWFYEDLQDFLEITHKKGALFIIGNWNAKVGSQETPGVTGKFGLGVQNEAEKRLIEFCQENTLVIANTLFQQLKRWLYTWTSPDGQHRNQTDYILCSQRGISSIQSCISFLQHLILGWSEGSFGEKPKRTFWLTQYVNFTERYTMKSKISPPSPFLPFVYIFRRVKIVLCIYLYV